MTDPLISPMYRAWQETASFSLLDWSSPDLTSNLTLKTHHTPEVASLAPKTALVRIKAAALNFRDLLTVAHSPIYPTPFLAGNAPCSDGAGVVVATGPGSVWSVGDRVILAQNKWLEGSDQRDFNFEEALGATVQGTLREFAIADDRFLIEAPEKLSWEEAATLGTAGGTAFRALFGEVAGQQGGVQAGDWVLTQGTGGVSLFAVQVCWVFLL
jgi:NADPH:quinone reductase-like Zn-dependent oxidoreductase